MKYRELKSAEDIVSLVEEVGFLPFFANGIKGFSIEENCPRELWFVDGVDGPWEWKGPAARSGKCVYGKFFGGKAGFVSLEWFPDFANYRRDGYDFNARYDDGLASRKDKGVYDTIVENRALLSKELKEICNYRKGGNKGFARMHYGIIPVCIIQLYLYKLRFRMFVKHFLQKLRTSMIKNPKCLILPSAFFCIAQLYCMRFFTGGMCQ